MIQHVEYANEEETRYEVVMGSGEPIRASLEDHTWVGKALREWLAEGNTPSPYSGPTELERWRLTAKVPALNAKIALMEAGLYEDAKALIEAGTARMQLAWSDAQYWYRDQRFVKDLAASMGLTDEEVDSLFKQAEVLEV